MSYIAPKDYSQDPEIFARLMKVMQGDLDLGWMKNIGERAAFRPSRPEHGLTLDDINNAPAIVAPEGAKMLTEEEAEALMESFLAPLESFMEGLEGTGF